MQLNSSPPGARRRGWVAYPDEANDQIFAAGALLVPQARPAGSPDGLPLPVPAHTQHVKVGSMNRGSSCAEIQDLVLVVLESS